MTDLPPQDGPASATATTAAARAHAREQEAAARLAAGTGRPAAPALPATSWGAPPDGVDPAELLWAEVVPGGRHASAVLAAGTRVRLTDLDGSACAHLGLWSASDRSERLNTADTVKVPWQAYLGAGHPLLSASGRVLATVVADTSGHHDALCGTTTRAGNEARYGDGSVHGPSPAGRELLVVAGAKHGIAPRDVASTVSFFTGVRVDPDGAIRCTGSAGAGASVELLLHLPLVVVLANTAHPLDEREEFATTALEVLAWRAPGDLLDLEEGLLAHAGEPDEAAPEHRRAVLNSRAARAAATPLELVR